MLWVVTIKEEAIKKEVLKMMREMPLEQIKVRKLCERLDIARSTFYVHYDSIYDVVEEIENEMMSERLFANKLNGITEYSSIREEVRASLDFLLEHAEIYESLLGNYGDESFKYKWARAITKRFQTLIISEEKSHEWKENVISFVIGGVQKMITNWLLHRDSISQESVEESMVEIIEALEKLSDR